MAKNKMLIDTTHPEETRVVVLKDGRVEEFDYESAARKLLRGNIYLAKVTRVEPSLQAAFVDYGGNRHGFLAFNEIHPDYYQIPMADRQALLEAEALAEADEDDDDDSDDQTASETSGPVEIIEDDDIIDLEAGESGNDQDGADDGNGAGQSGSDNRIETDASLDQTQESQNGETDGQDDAGNGTPDQSDDDGQAATVALAADSTTDSVITADYDEDDSNGADLSSEDDATAGDTGNDNGSEDAAEHQSIASESRSDSTPPVEQAGADDAMDDVRPRARRRARSYKIQEVIKRRQVILVQVVKEERGNKGAALTTYLSLAGRYTVLMPNTARGGGISRKITNPQDRKRLKAIAKELDVPEGMGLIIRTAGASRTKQEIRRDFEYLLRLWESVRDLTLNSQAPALVYEEGNLIKRSIRDLYNKDIDEVCVAGNEAYREAKDFMRMLMPSHAKFVTQHTDPESLFTKHGIERHLNAMFSPQVTLRSGGYLIINQTEALVAIDVNSGKSTREFSIEETALATNLEAADEIARQLRLRDLAGLIVIDFIDMEEKRNNRAVERRLKDALRHDRARIQLGRISHFGLMEMSRQRLRTGVLEGSTSQCPHCQGTGIIRSTESVALAVLRAIEDTALASPGEPIIATTSVEAAIYILNHKRPFINEIEHRQGILISVEASDKMQGANFTVARVTGAKHAGTTADRTVVNMEWGFDSPEPEPSKSRSQRSDSEDGGQGEGSSRRRRRRRGGRRNNRRRDENGSNGDMQLDPSEVDQPDIIDGDDAEIAESETSNGSDDFSSGEESDRDNRRPRRRRRGRRGGRRERERRSNFDDNETSNALPSGEQPDGEETPVASDEFEDNSSQRDVRPDSEPDQQENRDNIETPAVAEFTAGQTEDASSSAPARDEGQSSSGGDVSTASRQGTPRRAENEAPATPRLERVVVGPDDQEATVTGDESISKDDQPSRRGWWQRKLTGG